MPTASKYRVRFEATAPRSNVKDPEPVEGEEIIEANNPGDAMKTILDILKRHGFYDCYVKSCRKQKRG